jgi:hypothetical protein
MKPQMLPDRMTDDQLWTRGFTLIARAHPLSHQGPQDLEVTLQQLEAIFKELHLRGQQLALMPEPQRAGQPRTGWPGAHNVSS